MRSRPRASAFRSLLSVLVELQGVFYLLSTHVSSREPSTWRLLRDFSLVSVIVNKGSGYELGKLQRGWQKSKHWCWEGPQPCTIFCFMLTHHAWLNRPKHFRWLIVQYMQECFFLGRVTVEKSEQNDRTLGFITIPLNNYGFWTQERNYDFIWYYSLLIVRLKYQSKSFSTYHLYFFNSSTDTGSFFYRNTRHKLLGTEAIGKKSNLRTWQICCCFTGYATQIYNSNTSKWRNFIHIGKH